MQTTKRKLRLLIERMEEKIEKRIIRFSNFSESRQKSYKGMLFSDETASLTEIYESLVETNELINKHTSEFSKKS